MRTTIHQSVGFEYSAATGGADYKYADCTDCGNGLCELTEKPCICVADNPQEDGMIFIRLIPGQLDKRIVNQVCYGMVIIALINNVCITQTN